MVKNIKGGFRKPTVASSVKGAARTFKTRMPKTSAMIQNVLKEAKREVTVAGGMALLEKMGKSHKAPIGSNGLRLGPTKEKDFQEQKIDTKAVGGTTYSNCFYAYRPKTTLKSPRQNYRFKTSIQSAMVSGINAQNVIDVPVLHARAVQNNPATDQKYSNLTIQEAFEKVLRAQTKYKDDTGAPTELTIPESQMTVHLESVTAEMLITNGENPSEITIYDLVPQYDLGPTVYSSETNAAGYMSPYWCWKTGLVSETIDLKDPMISTNIGAKPSDSVTFSRSWTTIKKTRITMTPNSVHKHILMVGINKSIPYQKMAQASSDGGSFGGMCPTIMLVTRGMPTSTLLADTSALNMSCNLEFRTSSNLNQSPQAIVYDNTY